VVDILRGCVQAVPLEDLADVKAESIAEWIATDNVQRSIKKHFKDFLLTYRDESLESVYAARVRHLGESKLAGFYHAITQADARHTVNSESLEVSYMHLADSKAILAYFLVNAPSTMIALFSDIAFDVVLMYYPSYENIHEEIHVRITDLPTSITLRDLRRQHLNSLVRVSGVVTRRSGVFPQLKYVKFDCKKCGVTLGPFYQDTGKEIRISYCPNCEGRGPFEVNSDNVGCSNCVRAMQG